jgi:hypothetical protein
MEMNLIHKLRTTIVMAIAFTGEHASSGPQTRIVVPSKSFTHNLQMYVYACSRKQGDERYSTGGWAHCPFQHLCLTPSVSAAEHADTMVVSALYLPIGRSLDVSVTKLGELSMWRGLVTVCF